MLASSSHVAPSGCNQDGGRSNEYTHLLMAFALEVVLDELLFPEAPRWRDGRLWLSEKRAGTVLAVDGAGRVTDRFPVPGEPGGIGWLPDGTMLVVSMASRSVLQVAGDLTTTTYVDLSDLTTFRCNDMVVDQRGNAYVGDFGYDLAAGAPPAPGVLVVVRAGSREARVAADGLHFPNGSVVTANGDSLIVAESAANRLTAYDIDPTGTLLGRRVWAHLRDIVPDGICIDVEGAVWVADPLGNRVVRVHEGGRISTCIPTTQGAFACELGGDDGTTLYVCTYDAAASASPSPTPVGRLESTRVDVPAATIDR